jgi:hypothetical protein
VKLLARLLVLFGAVGIALYFQRSAAREIVLVYDLGGVRDATQLEVRIERGKEVVRRAEFPIEATSSDARLQQIQEKVRLPDGDYLIRVDLQRPGAVVHTDRNITVTESQTIMVPVGP